MKTKPSVGVLQKCYRVYAAFIVMFTILYYAFLLIVPEDKVYIYSDIMSPLGIFISVMVLFFSVKWNRNEETKKIWSAVLLGNLLFMFGDLPWIYYEIYLGTSVPYPSIADVFYIASPLCYFVAFWFYFKKSLLMSFRAAFDIFIVMVVLGTLEWKYILEPIFIDPLASGSGKLISILYPITTLVLGYISIIIYFSSYQRHGFRSKLLWLTPFVWAIADQTYSIQVLYGTYEAGSLIDPLWVLGLMIISLVSLKAVLFYEMIETPQGLSHSEPSPYKSILRTVMPYVLACFLISIMCFAYIMVDPISVGALATIFLIIIRQIFTVIENQRLMTELKKSNRELQENKRLLELSNIELNVAYLHKEEEANTDFLTKLFNRRHVDHILFHLEARAREANIGYSILLVDIDHFKKVNDKYGHDVGDEVLWQLGQILKEYGRASDVIGRWGGEEFIVIAEMTDAEELTMFAERLRSEVQDFSFFTAKGSLKLTVSIGGAVRHGMEAYDARSVISQADFCLYEAKNSGRNKVMIHGN